MRPWVNVDLCCHVRAPVSLQETVLTTLSVQKRNLEEQRLNVQLQLLSPATQEYNWDATKCRQWYLKAAPVVFTAARRLIESGQVDQLAAMLEIAAASFPQLMPPGTSIDEQVQAIKVSQSCDTTVTASLKPVHMSSAQDRWSGGRRQW